MTEYLMDHLIRQFGLPKLAMKTLGQIMPALINLHREH
jgi:hypothetical protein